MLRVIDGIDCSGCNSFAVFDFNRFGSYGYAIGMGFL